ncbi:hypothetical protein GY45DRAFT_1014517 [Cubamyces sp. BRFM 1775]|nr:hypothetical protein GY45DRAFT_1014517 [Cubamyces sp. BRFM 1775]
MSSEAKPVLNKYRMRKCNHCFVTGEEKKLFYCSQCKSQMYCSRECQKTDWKGHKSACKNNSMLETRLKAHERTFSGTLDRLFFPDGISLSELDKLLEKWVRFHRPTLMYATCLARAPPPRLSASLARSRTHLLYLPLAPRPHAEHQGVAGDTSGCSGPRSCGGTRPRRARRRGPSRCSSSGSSRTSRSGWTGGAERRRWSSVRRWGCILQMVSCGSIAPFTVGVQEDWEE